MGTADGEARLLNAIFDCGALTRLESVTARERLCGLLGYRLYDRCSGGKSQSWRPGRRFRNL